MYMFHLKSQVPEIFTVCLLFCPIYSLMMNCTGSGCISLNRGENRQIYLRFGLIILSYSLGRIQITCYQEKGNSVDRSTFYLPGPEYSQYTLFALDNLTSTDCPLCSRYSRNLWWSGRNLFYDPDSWMFQTRRGDRRQSAREL